MSMRPGVTVPTEIGGKEEVGRVVSTHGEFVLFRDKGCHQLLMDFHIRDTLQ
jgi:hypothetical protein